MTQPLTPSEIERYARHLVIPEIGGPGQLKLKAARVVVLGAGGLGAPCLLYLAAAGVGTLVIVDDDHVSLSNLQRQVLHPTQTIGAPKVETAKASLSAINDAIQIETHAKRLSADNADDLIAGADVVVDGSDSFETRATLAEACARLKLPLVSAAVSVWDGSLTVFAPFMERTDGGFYPSYSDLYPIAPEPGSLPTCAQVGVVGALTGMLGTMQAMETIKLVTGAGEPLLGRLLLVDARTMRFETLDV
ncbi:MAG: molybdopterin-synthase adenylyltransferase MoeB [Devosiaceae bacterium]|nr:molybdopterin-synthase adenylyltransferase MoeB [Devosiaceae bacterium MH13]